ncbi:ankyrin repeat protein [Pochonia chlamydosporia 170]|uniref:Ankyrin repeat protein n=1 Tax=Pochonia chlamydosporia 170 TaxID=1380566 RepID=A0A179F8L4_METCM|nr:ankyrin repeat protein [Pochonia chlamydosporia 170]OAQ61834.1 ankyrin repeat protein [Pochonia chlamydosporia 170]
MHDRTPNASEWAVLNTSGQHHQQQDRPPPAIVVHLSTPSGALVQAIFDQDLQAVNKVLDSKPDLANNLVSHRGPLYKKWLQDQNAGMGCCRTPRDLFYGTPPRLVEPAVVFAATAHSWKDASCVPRDIPAESVTIVRTLIERGATLSCSLGPHDPVIIDMVHQFVWPQQAIWTACSRQDSPEILELLVRAGADPLGSAINTTELREMAIEAATMNDGGGSVAFLLDCAIAAQDKIGDYIDMLQLAASMANERVVDVFLQKGAVELINKRLSPVHEHYNPFDSIERPRHLSPKLGCTVLMQVVLCEAFGYSGYKGSGLVRAWALPNNLRHRESLVHSLLDAGADATVRRIEDNATLVHGVCRWAGPNIIRRIISTSGCDIDETYHHKPSPSSNRHFDVAPPEFTCGGDGVGYLHIAARYFNLLGAQELIESGLQPREDASGRTALHWVALSDEEYSNFREEQRAKQRGYTSDPGLDCNPALQMSKYLVETGVAIDAQDCCGRTALHYTCRFKNVGLIIQLLSLNANCGVKDNEGNTALHALAQKGFARDVIHADDENILVVSELVLAFTRNQSFKPNEKNVNGETALIIACKMASITTVEVLLSIGCNPNISDEDLCTPLHHILLSPDHLHPDDTAESEQWEREDMRIDKLKKLLLVAGANERLVNNKGQTFADMRAAEAMAIAAARERGKEHIERLKRAREEEERGRRSRGHRFGLGSSGRGRVPASILDPEDPIPVSGAGHGRGNGR